MNELMEQIRQYESWYADKIRNHFCYIQGIVVSVTVAPNSSVQPASAILGIRLLEKVRPLGIETHLVITPAGRLTIQHETDYKVSDVIALIAAAGNRVMTMVSSAGIGIAVLILAVVLMRKR